MHWLEMDATAKEEFEDFADYRARESATALTAARREFMCRDSTIPAITAYVNKLSAEQRLEIAKAIEDEICPFSSSRSWVKRSMGVLDQWYQGASRVEGACGPR